MVNYIVEQSSYFEVTAKCGHVGKAYYYRGLFYVQAKNGKEAASLVRNIPRVKHHHKYAIQYVRKIERDEYEKGQARQRENPYFNCTSKQEQNLVFDLISNNVFLETKLKKKDNFDRKSKLAKLHRLYRKMNKYNYCYMEA